MLTSFVYFEVCIYLILLQIFSDGQSVELNVSTHKQFGIRNNIRKNKDNKIRKKRKKNKMTFENIVKVSYHRVMLSDLV